MMLRFVDDHRLDCERLSRREWLRVGGLGLGGGLTLPMLSAAAEHRPSSLPIRAKNVILFWLTGGAPQHDTWDPKPDGPDSARSAFGAISTRTPGLQVGGLMPRTAMLTDRIAVIRSMYTGDNAHSSSGYQMLTGIPHIPLNRENALPEAPNDWPSINALVRTQMADRNGLPAAITLPRRIANVGEKVWPGQDGGFLGRKFDPWLLTCDPSEANFNIPDLTLPEDVSTVRLNRRLSLLQQANQRLDALERHASSSNYELRSQQALRLLTGEKARNAFDLSLEKPETRDRYGRTKFGQSVLLARRLIEAGTTLVHVNWSRIDGKENNGGWDTHIAHHESLKGWLMPIMDQSYSALLEDLEQRGLLDETLVAWVAEFGHTPKINPRAGRDHWGRAFSIALAGGGIRGGVVHGATDSQAGEILADRTLPCDYAATVLHCLGIHPETTFLDAQNRPHPLSRGKVIEAVLG